MHIKLNKTQGLMAVVIDDKTRTAEVLDVDSVQVRALLINLEAHVVQLCLCLGGLDSKKTFHSSTKHAVASLSISEDRPEEKELYNLIIADYLAEIIPLGNFLKKLLKDYQLLKMANERVWGFDEITIEIDGVVAYTRIKPVV